MKNSGQNQHPHHTNRPIFTNPPPKQHQEQSFHANQPKKAFITIQSTQNQSRDQPFIHFPPKHFFGSKLIPT